MPAEPLNPGPGEQQYLPHSPELKIFVVQSLIGALMDDHYSTLKLLIIVLLNTVRPSWDSTARDQTPAAVGHLHFGQAPLPMAQPGGLMYGYINISSSYLLELSKQISLLETTLGGKLTLTLLQLKYIKLTVSNNMLPRSQTT